MLALLDPYSLSTESLGRFRGLCSRCLSAKMPLELPVLPLRHRTDAMFAFQATMSIIKALLYRMTWPIGTA